MDSRRKRARLELLVRQADGDGFEVREVGSAVAYLQSRPQRVPAAHWELARLPFATRGEATYILKNNRTEQILLITEAEKFLWEQMDGRASLQEIATAYVLRYGSFDFEIIPTLIVKLQRAQLLTMRPDVAPAGGARPQPPQRGRARHGGDPPRARAAHRLEPAGARRSSRACTAMAASCSSRRGPCWRWPSRSASGRGAPS